VYTLLLNKKIKINKKVKVYINVAIEITIYSGSDIYSYQTQNMLIVLKKIPCV